jgi:hypothetical protein
MILLIPMIIVLPLITFWFWMFKDMADNDYLSADEKNNWLLAFILMNVFAAGWYYLVEYRNRNL